MKLNKVYLYVGVLNGVQLLKTLFFLILFLFFLQIVWSSSLMIELTKSFSSNILLNHCSKFLKFLL